jgi:hypothetical protein
VSPRYRRTDNGSHEEGVAVVMVHWAVVVEVAVTAHEEVK